MMKKRLLARSVVLGLLCASVFGTSAWAATLTIDNSISSNNYEIYYGDPYYGSPGEKVINITGSNNKELTFNIHDSGVVAVVNSNGIGLSHESTGKTNIIVEGSNFQISYSAGSDNVTAIKSLDGVLTFSGKKTIVRGLIDNSDDSTLNFRNDLKVMYIDGQSDGIFNFGKMKIDGRLVVDAEYGGGYPSDSFYSSYASVNAISNYTELEANNIEYINGNVKHGHEAETNLSLVSGGIDVDEPFGIYWGMFQGNVLGSNENFKLKINQGTVWLPRNQSGEVEGVVLNGGWVSLSIDNYVWNESVSSGDFWSHNWNDSYDTLVLKNVKIENSNFSSSRNINDFVGISGGFSLSTDLANNQGDKFVFTGTPEIAPNVDKIGLFIWDKNATPQNMISEDQGKKVTIIEAPESSNMKFDAALGFNRNYESFRVYDPIIREETDGTTHKWNFVGWQSSAKSPEGESKQTWEDPYINVVDLENTLKRLNDIRTDPSEIGVWLRGESGKMKIRSYSYDYSIMSGGYDWDFDSNAAKMFLGFGISYAKNDCDTGIIGNTKSMGYNLYGSWLGKENKDYVDVIVKYGTLDKDYAGLDDNNVFVKGDYDKNLFSIAAKYGRRIEREDGWYWEPSVGLTWGRISSADYTDSQGIKIHADSSTSKMASLGVQVGKNIKGTEYYGKFEVRHDFDGKMHVSVPDSTLPGSSVYDDMGGTWYKVGIGAARKIDKNNSFYIDIEKDFGNKVKKPYSIGFGYRYTW